MQEILTHVSWADISVVPTVWSEGTSLAAVEALCAGVPVVTTPVGGLANIVVPGFNGFITPPTGQAIAGAIAQYRNADVYRKHRNAALSMRESLGVDRWRRTVGDWLRA